MALDGNMGYGYQCRHLLLQGHGSRHGPWWKHGQDLTNFSGSSSLCTSTVPHCPHMSRSGSLPRVHVLQLLFLAHLSIPCLLILVVPKPLGIVIGYYPSCDIIINLRPYFCQDTGLYYFGLSSFL